MRPADYFLPRGQVLQWHGQAGQCLQVCDGLIVLEELLWVEEQLLQPRQRLGPGSCYVLHSSGWVTLTALGDAQLRLPACPSPAAPAQWWATGLARLRRVADKLGGRWLRLAQPGGGGAGQLPAGDGPS